MILIFGGAYQGKLDFAKKKFGVTDRQVFTCTEGFEADQEAKILCNLEQAFLHLVKQNVNVTDMLAARRDDLKDKIIIIDDISQGVVPMDKTLRAWREATGQGHALSIRRGRRSIQSFLRHRPEDQVRRFYVILYSFYTSRDHPGYPE